MAKTPRLKKKSWHSGRSHKMLCGRSHNHPDNFKSSKQRKGFFGKVEKVKRSDRRSQHAKDVDRGIKADKVYPFTERGIKQWKRNPAHADLQYVDTPVIVRRAKKAKKRVKQKRIEVTRVERKDREIKRRVRVRKIRRRKAGKRRKLTGIEIENLKKLADVRGISRDLVDWDALIDKTLNYHENKAIIEDYLQGVGKKTMNYKAEIDRAVGELRIYLSELKWRLGNTADKVKKRALSLEIKALESGI